MRHLSSNLSVQVNHCLNFFSIALNVACSHAIMMVKNIRGSLGHTQKYLQEEVFEGGEGEFFVANSPSVTVPLSCGT